jgi:predicted lactoylglutathione lyase
MPGKVFINLQLQDINRSKQFFQDLGESLGGTIYGPAKNHGFMYQQSFVDPDGHKWEMVYVYF